MAVTKKNKSSSEDLISQFTNVLSKKSYEAKQLRGEESSIWEVEPVDLYTFLRHPDYLNLGENFVLSAAQEEIILSAEDFENGVNTYVIWCGKGAGKNTSTRILFLRLVYKLLCMRSPAKYFNMQPTDIITLMNLASNAEQASAAFFEPLKIMIRHAGPKAFAQFGFNIETDLLDKEANFPKNIQLYSGHSKADSLEGRNILAAVVDEIDGDTFQKPEKMWTMVNSSSRSRFVGKQKIFAISFMRYDGSNGMIKKLYEEYQGVPYAMVRKYPTWVFNPRPDVTREAFEEEFRRFPEQAACIYACEPPESTIDAWIKDSQRIKNSMKEPEGRWPLKFPIPNEQFKKYPTIEAVRMLENGEQVVLDPFNLEFEDWFVGKPGVVYAFIGDPGLGSIENGGDAYGVCLGHRELLYDPSGKVLIRPVVDFVFRFTGYMFKEREIQLDAVHNLIMQLKEERGFDIRIFSFDAWNSATTAQWLRRRYGASVTVEFKKAVGFEEYNLLREHIFGEAPPSSGNGEKLENGGIDWFYHPILYRELKELVADLSKRKVDHKPGESKDMADPVASLVWRAVKNWPHVGVEVSAGKLNSRLKQAKSGPVKALSPLRGVLKRLDSFANDLRMSEIEEHKKPQS